MQTAETPAVNAKAQEQSFVEWIVEGLVKSGAIASRDRAKRYMMPRTTEDERAAILRGLFGH